MNAVFQYDFFLRHNVKDKAVARAFSRSASNRERCRPAHAAGLSAIRFLSLLAAALTATGTISRGGIFDDTNAINAAAELATTNAFCDPVGIFGMLVNGSWYADGTAEVIETNIAVITAHQALIDNIAGMAYAIRNNIDGSLIAKVYADWWIVHPAYVGIPGQGRDAALVHFTNTIPVTPITRFRGQDVSGTAVWLVGTGKVGVVGSTDPLVYDRRKRCWTNTIASIGSATIDNNFIVTQFVPGTANGAPGDSGGALLVETNGEKQLAGILACVSPADGRNYGDRTGCTRISVINPWIDQVIESLSPTLSVVQVDATTVTLSWLSPAPGFVLQQTTNLTDWTNSVATVSDDGTNKHATFSTSGAQTFWRLIAQPFAGQVPTLHPGLAKPASDLNAPNRDVGDLLRLVREPEE